MNVGIVLWFMGTFVIYTTANDDKGKDPEVTIHQGTLRGSYRQAWKGRTFSAFTGIPFAEPPVGELRFEPALPAKPWKGILDATKSHPICTQINILLPSYIPEGQEDCLYLNVYTPLKKNYLEHKLPVMVFIHGGGWTCGEGNREHYGPDFLLEEDVVLVAINYRLGAFGFLSTEDGASPGNYGMKDQVLALQWINQNVANFGGDPNSVTIFGHSVGAASAILHIFSPLSKGLFHKCIAQSGSALASWAVAKPGNMLKNTKELAKKLNCTTESNKEMVKCLKKMDAYDIVNQDRYFYIFSYDPLSPYMPVIEEDTKGSFLTDNVTTLLNSKQLSDVPLMIGITSEDGGIKSAAIHGHPNLLKTLDENFSTLMPIMFHYDETSPQIWSSVKEFYFGTKGIQNNTIHQLSKLFTDIMLAIPAQNTVEMFTKYFSQPIYYYLFGYRGEMSFSSEYNDFDYGVCHGDDLYYLLSRDYFNRFHLSTKEQQMRDFMVKLWANFAKFGNPTPEKSLLTPIIWKEATSDNSNYYHIKSIDDVQMNKELYAERLQFWKKIFHKNHSKIEL